MQSGLSQESTQLHVHEWFSIVVIIGLILCLWLVTFFSDKGETLKNELPFLLNSEQKIDVLMKGAVNHPGVYKIVPGMLMKDLLQLAELMPNADLRRLNPERPINRPRILNINKKETLTIYLQGAVKKPGLIEVPKGTIVSDLEGVIELEENADRKFLKKKRRLKTEEVIEVPFETTPQVRKKAIKKRSKEIERYFSNSVE